MILVEHLQNAFWLKAGQLLVDHTNPWELDEALTGWGYTLGPCEAQDLHGLERVRARLDQGAYSTLLSRMISEGRMGKTTAWGFYRYPGGGGAVIDPLIEDLIREEARFARHTRSEIASNEILRHMNECIAQTAIQMRDDGVPDDDLAQTIRQALHYPGEQPMPF